MGMSLETESIIAAAKAGMPVMLVSAPGMGKTATIQHIAKENGYTLITVILSGFVDGGDVQGLPSSKAVGKSSDGNPIFGTVYSAPWWQIKGLTSKKVMFFFDEYSNGNPSVRASLLTAFQSRIFPNGYVIPDDALIVGAMNPPEEATDGFELDLATTNRIMFIDWDPPVQDWIDGMRTNWGQETEPEELRWKNIIASFIDQNRSLLHKQPTNEISDANVAMYNIGSSYSAKAVARYAWPSRRSWDNLSRLLVHAKKDPIHQDIIIRGTVGPEAAVKFREFLMTNETKITLDDVLNSPHEIDWVNMNINDANVVINNAIEKIDSENASKVIALFGHIADVGRESLCAGKIESLVKTVQKTAKEIIMNSAPDEKEMNKEWALSLKNELKTVIRKYNAISQAGQN